MNLPAIATKDDTYCLLGFDQAPRFAHWLGLDLTQPSNEQLIKQFFTKFAQTLAPHASGLVLDPIYTLDLVKVKADQTGLLSRLTVLQEEVDPLAMPRLIPHWSVEDIRNNYSLAKLELYYHPREKQALAKKQFLAEIYDYCQYEKISLCLQLIIYTPADQEFSEDRFQEDQLQAIQELRSSADLFALQYPLGPLPAATVTAELDKPWILMTQDQSYEQFKQVLRVAIENGAQGFLATDSLWPELKNYKRKDQGPDWEQLYQFAQTTIRDRVIELVRISHER